MRTNYIQRNRSDEASKTRSVHTPHNNCRKSQRQNTAYANAHKLHATTTKANQSKGARNRDTTREAKPSAASSNKQDTSRARTCKTRALLLEKRNKRMRMRTKYQPSAYKSRERKTNKQFVPTVKKNHNNKTQYTQMHANYTPNTRGNQKPSQTAESIPQSAVPQAVSAGSWP